jgi:hypothetical protein
MAELLPVGLDEMIVDMRREIRLRLLVYRKAVDAKTMSQKVAERRIEISKAILARLEQEEARHAARR